ncbi:protease complex subunit PrcB family protein [Sedimentibacter saalensis]|uniref:protease complex subunit PrcB family protein n=1 Tax=Sedimentibacter saalensis TaxID=130788 RepID=UPI00289F28ED|nr:protease complex subunit PrcB family protein [Sedimentibacter saalensis]
MEKLITNKKNISIGILVLGVIFIIIIFLKFNAEKRINVEFDTINPENLPNQIASVLPNYRMKEKAILAKVDDEVYVIVTRGEKASVGYDVEIGQLILNDEGGEIVLTVYAEYTDPKPGDVAAQILTYPFTVVKTDMKELPQKIVLEKEYKD